MRSFKEYLKESKNMHLTHIEDIILLDGPSGAARSLAFLDSIVKMLAPNLTESKITLKWDGSPAIIAGIDPQSGKFFVGTKAVFSKGGPKINFTNADIDKNHGSQGDLAPKLKDALKYLPSVWKKGVYQGDMMFTKKMLKRETINGESTITFKPNTITYAAPLDSDLGKKIAGSQFGIVFHTKYSGDEIVNMKASFDVSINDFKPSSKVWFDDAEFKDASKDAQFTNTEAGRVLRDINALKKSAPAVQQALKRIFTNKGNISSLIQFNNAKIKEGVGISDSKKYYESFVDWLAGVKKAKLKTWDDAKDKAFRQDMQRQAPDYIKVLDFYSGLKMVKKVIIGKLNTINKMRTFVQTDSGYRVVGHEGFVAITNDGSSVKLVDRMEFSKNNFSTDKGWAK